MQFQQREWSNSTTFAMTLLVMLAVTPQALRADEMLTFGQLTGMHCQGASAKSVPGFAVSTFSLADSVKTSPGGSTGTASFTDVNVVKGLDDCTPLLFGAVARGTRFTSATLTVVSKVSFEAVLLIQLQDVVVSGARFTEGAANLLDEVVSLSYAKIKITHVPSGKSFSWDVVKNVLL